MNILVAAAPLTATVLAGQRPVVCGQLLRVSTGGELPCRRSSHGHRRRPLRHRWGFGEGVYTISKTADASIGNLVHAIYDRMVDGFVVAGRLLLRGEGRGDDKTLVETEGKAAWLVCA